MDDDAMARRLLDFFESSDYRPFPLPPAATDLIALSRRGDATVADASAILDRDVLVAASFLRFAEEAGMAAGVKVKSLTQAIFFVGLLDLRDYVIQLGLDQFVLRGEAFGIDTARLRRHSIATAHLCRAISEAVEMDGELAYLAGLMHDIGLAGALLALRDHPDLFDPEPELEAVWRVIERTHLRIGAIMIERWGLPPEIGAAVHHEASLSDAAEPNRIAAAVALANDLAHAEGFGVFGDEKMEEEGIDGRDPAHARVDGPFDRTPRFLVERACEILGLDARARHMVTVRARDALKRLRDRD